jgi:hypothetical protein
LVMKISSLRDLELLFGRKLELWPPRIKIQG